MAFVASTTADRIQRRLVELEDSGYAPFEVVMAALEKAGVVDPENDLEYLIKALKAQGAEQASDLLARVVAQRCTELLREQDALREALVPFIKS